MKKLFMLVALSLAMVACNKDKEKDLSYWDKVIEEMSETKLSARDVLASLRENEYWNIITDYHYVDNNGQVEEIDYSGPMPGDGRTTYRFNKDICTLYSLHNSLGYYQLYCVDYTIKGDDLNFVCSLDGKDLYKWGIIAYDENQVLVEIHNLDVQKIESQKPLLYRKLLLGRKIDDSKWWETTETNK